MQKALDHLTAADPVMGRLIGEIGPYAIEFLAPNFETLTKAIVLQQISGKAAEAIYNRLMIAAGNGRLTPEAVLKMRAPKLRKAGLSRQKIEYIRDVARRTLSGDLDFESLRALPDSEVYRRLTSIKGIGVWTVQMFLIFALERTNVLPSGDLGIRAAVRKAYGLEATPTPRQVDEIGANWSPWASVASWYLWRSLETKAGL
jgi:DNA-3-methyladenine glycosylase II